MIFNVFDFVCLNGFGFCYIGLLKLCWVVLWTSLLIGLPVSGGKGRKKFDYHNF